MGISNTAPRHRRRGASRFREYLHTVYQLPREHIQLKRVSGSERKTGSGTLRGTSISDGAPAQLHDCAPAASFLPSRRGWRLWSVQVRIEKSLILHSGSSLLRLAQNFLLLPIVNAIVGIGWPCWRCHLGRADSGRNSGDEGDGPPSWCRFVPHFVVEVTPMDGSHMCIRLRRAWEGR